MKTVLETLNEYATFGEHVENKLKKLSDNKLQANVQVDINKILYEAETRIGQYNNYNEIHLFSNNLPSTTSNCWNDYV